MWDQWLENIFVLQENKNNDFIQQFFSYAAPLAAIIDRTNNVLVCMKLFSFSFHTKYILVAL